MLTEVYVVIEMLLAQQSRGKKIDTNSNTIM